MSDYGKFIDKAVAKDRFDNIFTYHCASESDIESYQKIREKSKELARIIEHHTPPCADQRAAIRKLRECVMTANASIELKGVS